MKPNTSTFVVTPQPKLTVEERLKRLEEQVFEPHIFYGQPLAQRHNELMRMVTELAKYLGLHWRYHASFAPPPSWEPIEQPWWRRWL